MVPLGFLAPAGAKVIDGTPETAVIRGEVSKVFQQWVVEV
jgi:hypothetical protein